MLELRDVDAGYGMTRVLRKVSLQVPDGKVVALLGANGAGKTTLLRTAARLQPISAGSIHFNGETVTGITAHKLARRGVCYVPDWQGVFRSLSVKENLHLFGAQGNRRQVTERAVDLFPILGQRMSQTAGTMSGGEQQMLALVRASVAGGKLAMLDEVSMGLAPRIVDEIFEGLHKLASTGMALLLVEQYVKRALEMADHVYLLSRGSVTFDGSPEDLDPDALMRSYVGVDSSVVEGAS